jgi:hypothetical protein
MQAKNVNSIAMKNTFTVITTVVKIMIELPGATTKQERAAVMTKVLVR